MVRSFDKPLGFSNCTKYSQHCFDTLGLEPSFHETGNLGHSGKNEGIELDKILSNQLKRLFKRVLFSVFGFFLASCDYLLRKYFKFRVLVSFCIRASFKVFKPETKPLRKRIQLAEHCLSNLNGYFEY